MPRPVNHINKHQRGCYGIALCVSVDLPCHTYKTKPESKVTWIWAKSRERISSTPPSQYNLCNNFQQRMSWLPQRWRTQRNAIRNANCRTSWIIKILNAHCASGICLGACLVWVSLTPLACFVSQPDYGAAWDKAVLECFWPWRLRLHEPLVTLLCCVHGRLSCWRQCDSVGLLLTCAVSDGWVACAGADAMLWSTVPLPIFTWISD